MPEAGLPAAKHSRGALLEAGGVDPPMPPLSAPWIADRLMEIGPVRSNGMAKEPIDFDALQAWSHMTCTPISPWEAKLLVRLAREYLAESHRAEHPLALPPYQTEPTPEELAWQERRMRAAFG